MEGMVIPLDESRESADWLKFLPESLPDQFFSSLKNIRLVKEAEKQDPGVWERIDNLSPEEWKRMLESESFVRQVLSGEYVPEGKNRK